MDRIIYNGKVCTMDEGRPVASVIAIKDGKIEKIGGEEILELASKETELVNREGKFITPGIIDSHVHLLKGGLGLNYVDLTKCTTINEIIEKSKEYISREKPPEGTWILGRGWNQYNLEEKRFLMVGANSCYYIRNNWNCRMA